MNKLFAALFVLLMCLSCVYTGSINLRDDGYQNLAESVVVVRRPGHICTGFFISNEEVLTAAHCLESSPGLHIYEVIGYRQYTRDGNIDGGTLFRVVEADPTRDLALLEALFEDSVDYSHHPAHIYDGAEVPVGTPTISVGHPAGQLFTVTTGIISRGATTITTTGVTYLFSNAPIFLGNSGGPLFDERGRVIGLANSIMSAQSFLGIYVSYNEIHQFLEEIDYGTQEEASSN